MGKTGNAERVLRLASECGALRPRDLAGNRIPRTTLSRLVESGRLVQISRGLYALPDHSRSEQHQLADIAVRNPQGVFCLLTALRFHELTTQSPHEASVVPHSHRQQGIPQETTERHSPVFECSERIEPTELTHQGFG
jgi:hypothetical protein